MKIPQKAARLPKQNLPNTYLTDIERKALGITTASGENGFHDPYVSLKYFRPSFECFSEWTHDELKALSRFIEKLRQTTWIDITTKTGGSIGQKTGLGYTTHKDRNKLPDLKDLNTIISNDITFFELRVTDKARVHGFRVKSAFFLIWLDREHRIYAM